MARQPLVDAMRAAVLVDQRLRTLSYTAAAAVPGTEQYYLGTNGGGLVAFDGLMQRFDPLPFGLLSPGAGAVLAIPGGVWVGTDGRGPRSGLTFVADDLQQFAYEEGPRGTAFGGRSVRALLARGGEIWAATEHGVVRIEPRGETRRITTVNGLPDDETLALAQGPSGVWIGTAAGLGFVPADSDRVVRPDGPIAPVLALFATRDTVWIGMTVGLGLAVPGGDVLIPEGWDAVPELRSPIVALTRVADTLVAATADRLLWQAPGAAWRVVPAVGSLVGVITSLAPDAGGVWVGGRTALVRFGFAASDLLVLRVPGDVPGLVRGLALEREYLWVATDAGLVRFERRALTP
jgi:ligand-binding sensor domain-containing protein